MKKKAKQNIFNFFKNFINPAVSNVSLTIFLNFY